jgi:hypothetical protein
MGLERQGWLRSFSFPVFFIAWSKGVFAGGFGKNHVFNVAF